MNISETIRAMMEPRFVGHRVVGNCMEGAGIYDGGVVVVDHEAFPRPPRYKSKGGDGSFDCCVCLVDGQLMVKRYSGVWGGIQMVSTCYAIPKPGGMDSGFFADCILGVVVASYDAGGREVWRRSSEEFAFELETQDTIRGVNVSAPVPCESPIAIEKRAV